MTFVYLFQYCDNCLHFKLSFYLYLIFQIVLTNMTYTFAYIYLLFDCYQCVNRHFSLFIFNAGHLISICFVEFEYKGKFELLFFCHLTHSILGGLQMNYLINVFFIPLSVVLKN